MKNRIKFIYAPFVDKELDLMNIRYNTKKIILNLLINN